MAKAKSDTGVLPIKSRVVAARPLVGVPEGTAGRIQLVNGLTWMRYWVQWDNGVWLGSIDAAAVVEEDDWSAYQERREAAAAEAAKRATEAPVPEPAAPTGATADAPAADGAASKIPAALLARSQAAKAKKAAAASE